MSCPSVPVDVCQVVLSMLFLSCEQQCANLGPSSRVHTYWALLHRITQLNTSRHISNSLGPWIQQHFWSLFYFLPLSLLRTICWTICPSSNYILKCKSHLAKQDSVKSLPSLNSSVHHFMKPGDACPVASRPGLQPAPWRRKAEQTNTLILTERKSPSTTSSVPQERRKQTARVSHEKWRDPGVTDPTFAVRTTDMVGGSDETS